MAEGYTQVQARALRPLDWLHSETRRSKVQHAAEVAPPLTLRFLFALLRWLDPKPCLPPSALSPRAAWQVCCCLSRLCRAVPWNTVHCLCACLRPAAGMLAEWWTHIRPQGDHECLLGSPALRPAKPAAWRAWCQSWTRGWRMGTSIQGILSCRCTCQCMAVKRQQGSDQVRHNVQVIATAASGFYRGPGN